MHTSHWHFQILLFNTVLWLCYCPEYLSSSKNITVYAMINILIKPYVFSCCVSNNQYSAGDINSTNLLVLHQIYNNGPGSVESSEITILWPYETGSKYPHGKHLLYLMQPPQVCASIIVIIIFTSHLVYHYVMWRVQILLKILSYLLRPSLLWG
jgi:hypothetical protein